MLKRIFLVVHIFVSVYASAQSTIKGKVTQEDSITPVEFATVRVMQDGILVLGTVADEKGNFILTPIDSGKYDIIVNCVEFKQNGIENIEIKGNTIKDLGIIKLIYSYSGFIDCPVR